MKVEVKELEQKSLSYPKLMVHKSYGYIVLFNADHHGTLISCEFESEIGTYSGPFDMDNFNDFHGEVTLSN